MDRWFVNITKKNIKNENVDGEPDRVFELVKFDNSKRKKKKRNKLKIN